MRGTTTSTAQHFKSVSEKARPATDGNKNISTGGAKRQPDQLGAVKPLWSSTKSAATMQKQ